MSDDRSLRDDDGHVDDLTKSATRRGVLVLVLAAVSTAVIWLLDSFIPGGFVSDGYGTDGYGEGGFGE
jgi:hypothetical protein